MNECVVQFEHLTFNVFMLTVTFCLLITNTVCVCVSSHPLPWKNTCFQEILN